MPAPTQSALAIVQTDPQLSSFAQLITVAGMDAQLDGPGAYTVFAPINAAIDALSNRDALLADPALARQFVESHVLAQALRASDLAVMTQVTTLNGTVLQLVPGWVNAGQLIETDRIATNGVVDLVNPAVVSQ